MNFKKYLTKFEANVDTLTVGKGNSAYTLIRCISRCDHHLSLMPDEKDAAALEFHTLYCKDVGDSLEFTVKTPTGLLKQTIKKHQLKLDPNKPITNIAALAAYHVEILKLLPDFPITKEYNYYAMSMATANAHTSGVSSVRKAQRINPATGELEPKIFAVKSFKKNFSDHEKEAKITSCYSFAEKLVTNQNGEFLLVSEYFPGEEVISSSHVVASSIKTLSFAQRIELIWQHALHFNLMHHITPATGGEIVHSDLKGPNIKIHVYTRQIKTRRTEEKLTVTCTDVFPFDYGTAIQLEDDKDTAPVSLIGTSCMIAPEVTADVDSSCSFLSLDEAKQVTGYVSTRSDTYAAAPIYMAILGATQPYAKRKEPILAQQKISDAKQISFVPGVDLARLREQTNAGFDEKGLFAGLATLAFPLEVKDYEPFTAQDIQAELQEIIKNFLVRMRAQQSQKRPRTDNDEDLHFATVLNNLCKAVEHTAELQAASPEINVHNDILVPGFAKLLLLHHKKWAASLGVDTLADEKLGPGIQYTFADFDFYSSDNLSMCHQIIGKLLDGKDPTKLGILIPSPAKRTQQAIIEKLKRRGLYEERLVSPLDNIILQKNEGQGDPGGILLSFPAKLICAVLEPDAVGNFTKNEINAIEKFKFIREFSSNKTWIEKLNQSQVMEQFRAVVTREEEKNCTQVSDEVAELILMQLKPEEFTEYLANRSEEEKLNILQLINSCKPLLIAAIGEENYTAIVDKIANNLLAQTQIYLDGKASCADDSYTGWRFGYSTGEKRSAANFFVEVIKTANFACLFSRENREKLNALKGGNLKTATASVMQLVEQRAKLARGR